MLGIGSTSRKPKYLIRAGGVCFAALCASAGWSATQIETLTPGEISRDQIAELSRQQPYVWSRATNFRDLGAPLAEQVPAAPAGPPAGILTAEQQNAGFAWNPAQGLIVLKGLPSAKNGVSGSDETEDLRTGWQQDGGEHQAFVWSGDGLLDLNALVQLPEGMVLSEAQNLGATGAVVGRALEKDKSVGVFIWTPGAALQLLPAIEGAAPETAKAVSPRGHVIGQANLAGISQGFVWREGATARLLATPEGSPTEALGVNATGDVVGAKLADGLANRSGAMLWPADGSAAIDLNDRLSGKLPDGVTLIRAEAINNAGEIAAYGLTDKGSVQLVLLTPKNGHAKRLYTPQVLGEVYIDAAAQPLSVLEITESSDIYGACAPLAQACFSFGSLQAQELARLAGVTNLFDPGLQGGPQVLSLPSGLGASSLEGGGTPVGGSLDTSSSGGRTPTPGTPFFPALTTPSSTTGNPVTASPVPVPAALWGMLVGLALLLRPWALRRGRSR